MGSYNSISVKVIADSISPQGIRLTTFELEYPRFIHAEIMTHRMFSRNAQSSRAVPVTKALQMNTVEPLVWGKNKAGMSSEEILSKENQFSAQTYWNAGVNYCRTIAERLSETGLHKQWANRITEWFSPIKVVVTATEWDNFFWLRDDPDAAQPEIVELARQMKKVMSESNPNKLSPGEWHLPYIHAEWLAVENKLGYFIKNDDAKFIQIDLDTAKKISASACAQVSYRRLDTSIEKALDIYGKLFDGPKPHLSPVEHQATPSRSCFYIDGTWPEGITHVDRNSQDWSGNLRGWIQYRQLIG